MFERKKLNFLLNFLLVTSECFAWDTNSGHYFSGEWHFVAKKLVINILFKDRYYLDYPEYFSTGNEIDTVPYTLTSGSAITDIDEKTDTNHFQDKVQDRQDFFAGALAMMVRSHISQPYLVK